MTKRILSAVLAVLMLAAMLCSCSQKPAETTVPVTTDSTAGSTEGTSAETDNTTADSDGEIDIYAPYEEPITVSYARDTEEYINFMNDENWEDNVWTRYLYDNMGINLDLAWSTTADHYDEKASLTIASGELPDMMWVNFQDYMDMAEAGLLEDLTDVYEEYCSDFTKSLFEDNPYIMEGLKVNGRMYGLPYAVGSADGQNFCYLNIRQDWLDNLGLEAPKSFDDLKKVAIAFTEDDPDGNGKDDTYGICLNKEVIGGLAGADPVMQAAGAFNDLWLEKDGDLVYSNVQPEMRDALQFLQELYAAGAIDPEFMVKDSAKAKDEFVAGKAGMMYGMAWASSQAAAVEESIPGADQVSVIVYNADGTSEITQVAVGTLRQYKMCVVRKGYEHPEALMKMASLWTDHYEVGGPFYEPDFLGTYDYGQEHNIQIQEFKYPFITPTPSESNMLHQQEMKPIFEEMAKHDKLEDVAYLRDTIENPFRQGMFDRAADYLYNGNMGNAGFWANAGAGGSLSKALVTWESGNYIRNKFDVAPTETMTSEMPSLKDLFTQTAVKIISGDDISLFDEYVEQWHMFGGDDITAEVNEWYHNK